MNEASVVSQIVAMSVWEAAAVLLSVAYLVLATREHIACWVCALASTVIYTLLFWNESLLMDSALNIYYVAMALYGWWCWRRGGLSGVGVAISRWSWQRHGGVIALVICLSLISGSLLSRYSSAAWPYVDSFTTWGAVVTTWMVAHKILENWIYWFVIDAVSVPLYLDRGLYLTAALFVMYLFIVVFGFLQWRREFVAKTHVAAHA